MNRRVWNRQRPAKEQMVLESVDVTRIDNKAAGAERIWEDARIQIWIWLKALSPYIITVVLLYVCQRQGDTGQYWKLTVQDALLMLGCFVCYLTVVIPAQRGMKERKKALFFMLIPAVLMLFVSNYAYGIQEDRPVKREFYEEATDADIGKLTAKAVQGEEGFYRTEQLGTDEENAANLNRVWDMDQYLTSVYSSSYNEDYRRFREETFGLEEPFRNYLMMPAARNPVYQRFMGVKYVLSKEAVPGYELIERKGRWSVYQNEQVSPAAYATDRVISTEDYGELEFPYNQLALLEYAVAEEDAEVSAERKKADASKILLSDRGGVREAVEQIDVELPEMVAAEESKKMYIELPSLEEQISAEGVAGVSGGGDKVLFLKFRIENLRPREDVSVWVEGIRNKLTARSHFYYNGNTEFTYAAPLEEGQESVEIIFGKGRYKITDAEAFIGLLPEGKTDKTGNQEEQLYQSVFRMNRERTGGNRIEGTIDVKKPGYFITTIPYDENFEIQADGRQVEAEKVNTAFLGFKIGAGEHKVQILYHAPGVKAGKVMSVMGLLLFLFLRRLQRRRY